MITPAELDEINNFLISVKYAAESPTNLDHLIMARLKLPKLFAAYKQQAKTIELLEAQLVTCLNAVDQISK